MSPVKLQSATDANGILNLSVPLGKSAGNRAVRVTVEPLDEAAPVSAALWPQFVRELAGSIPDPTFERRPVGSQKTDGDD
jgi:hypothetical protein